MNRRTPIVEHASEPGDQMRVVHQVARRQRVERIEEPVGEDGVDAVVHPVEVDREGHPAVPSVGVQLSSRTLET
jgi:hypothetical protein